MGQRKIDDHRPVQVSLFIVANRGPQRFWNTEHVGRLWLTGILWASRNKLQLLLFQIDDFGREACQLLYPMNCLTSPQFETKILRLPKHKAQQSTVHVAWNERSKRKQKKHNYLGTVPLGKWKVTRFQPRYTVNGTRMKLVYIKNQIG